MNPPSPIDRRTRRRIVAAGIVSLAAWAALQAITPHPTVPWSEEMRQAASNMERAIEVLARHTESANIAIDESLDPNRTGLIGPELTPLFTTLGQLEAKRTTTNPDLAGLLVYLLRRAGVGAGDTVAVGCSASFPALLIATESAAEAMDVHPVMILSLGASSYGATRPEFNLLDIQQTLMSEGLFATAPAAVSLGGENDIGREFDPALRERLLRQVRADGIEVVEEPDLRRNVGQRMAIYGRPTAFMNIGGADANLGFSPLVLRVEPGLNMDLRLPPPEQRGVLFEMAAHGTPVIHLLHIRGLALRYGLPWDPIPLPEPGTTPLRDGAGGWGWAFWLITAVYLAVLGLIAAVRWPGFG